MPSLSLLDIPGIKLDSAEIFEMMNNMGYKYEVINGIEFNWLLKRE